MVLLTNLRISLVFPNEKEMIITQGTKDFALGLYERVFGYNPAQLLAEEKKKNEAKLAKERQKVEEERLQLLAALQREEEERQRLHVTIFNLHHIAKMSVTEIALIVNLEPETIDAIIANHSGE